MPEWENNVPVFKYPNSRMGNTALQRHVVFKIFYTYNYMSLFHNICLKDLYRHKRLCEISF